MGEEVGMRDNGDEDRVLEWEDGLPNTDDLMPLSQILVSPELASAFSINPEPCQTMIDVNRASQSTISSLRKQNLGLSSNNFKSLPSFRDDSQTGSRDPIVVEEDAQEEIETDEHDKIENEQANMSEKRKLQRMEDPEEAYSTFQADFCTEDQSARALKRPRLVWTPQLHKRFVDVVAHLGIKNAVPKTIMQLMNVEGLTRENVASHLQKYRMYLKRMQGLSDEGPSASDQLFASTPVPPSLNESNNVAAQPVPLPMHYGHPLMPMPVVGSGHIRMPAGLSSAYHGFDRHHYNIYREQHRDWSGHKFGSLVSHHDISSNNR